MWLYFMKKQDLIKKNIEKIKKEKLALKLRENLKKRKKIKK